MKKKKLILILFGIAFGFTKAQNIGHYPDFYNLFTCNPYISNPSWIPDSSKFEINFNRKMLTGEFKDIASTQFNFSYTNEPNPNFRNLFRIIINTEQEGPYINIPSFLINYATEIKLAPNLKLYSGLALGTTGIYFSAPSSTNSFYMPDGNLGFGIKYKKLLVGSSLKQFFNNNRYNFYLRRYYQTNLFYSKEINTTWKLNFSSIVNYYLDSKNEYRIQLTTVFMDRFEIGFSNKNTSSLTFLSKLNFPITENKTTLNIGFAYTSNKFSNNRNLPNSFELYLGYLWK